MRSDAVGQRAAPVAGSVEDPRVTGLSVAVIRLRSELDGYPSPLCDRATAEDALDALAVQAATGTPVAAGLRHSLLLLAAAVGSVSALSSALAELRRAIELFGEPPAFQRTN